MSDEMQRLLDGALDPRVRSALEAARTDGPSAAHLRRAAQTLGLPAASAGHARAAGAAGGAKAGKATVTPSLLKWMGTASIIGGVLVGAFVAWPLRPGTDARAVVPAAHGLPQVTLPATPLPDTRPPEPRAVDSKPVSARVPAVAGSAALPATVSVPVAAVAAVAPIAASPLARTGDERTHAPAATPSRYDSGGADHPSASTGLAHSVASDDAPAERAVATVDTLREETALLDAARRAMQAGNAAGAIALLDRYDASPSLRALASEALLLRARALAKAGHRAKACAAARLYVEKHGTDGYAGELERSCVEPGAPPR